MKKNILYLLFIFLIFLLNACSNNSSSTKKNQTSTEKKYYVEAEYVKKGVLNRVVKGKGELEEWTKAYVSPKFPGKIEKLYFSENEYVKKGQIIASLEKTYLIIADKQASAALDKATTNFQTAQKDFERIKKLYDKGSVSQQIYDHSLLNYNQAKAQLESAKASKEEIALKLEDADIKSPINGVIVNKLQDIGEMAAPGKPIYVIFDIDKLKFVFNVPSEYASKLNKSLNVKIKIEGFDKYLNLKVDEIKVAVDKESRNIELKAYINNKDRIYKPGMFGEYILFIEKKPDALYLKKQCIFEEQGKNYVYKISNHNTGVLTQIKTGIIYNDLVEIIDGLSLNDRVISYGYDQIRDGDKVIITNENK